MYMATCIASLLLNMLFCVLQGRFDILALSGSFQLSENGGQRSRAGSLTVSLAGPDGRVLGGGVAGLLTAASPVQVHFFYVFVLFIIPYKFSIGGATS